MARAPFVTHPSESSGCSSFGSGELPSLPSVDPLKKTAACLEDHPPRLGKDAPCCPSPRPSRSPRPPVHPQASPPGWH